MITIYETLKCLTMENNAYEFNQSQLFDQSGKQGQ